MKKIIVRWNVGKTTKEGFDCLKYSIKKFKHLYKDYNIEYFICFNDIEKEKFSDFKDMNLINKKDFTKSLPIDPPKKTGLPAWKLYPPRLDKDSHEIIIDNDLILFKKPEIIEEFFKSDDLIITTESLKRSYSGKLKDVIPNNFNINTGLICLPPKFDFKKKIIDCINEFNLDWKNHFDEQTCLAYIFSKHKNLSIIKLTDIYVCHADYKNSNCGFHFAGVNDGNKNYWEYFLLKTKFYI